jgi:hypothetical protein
MEQVLRLSVLVIGSIAIYVVSLWLSGLRWRHVYR